jgi:hypothetical protein
MDRCFRNISPPKDSRSCNYTENPREVTLALFLSTQLLQVLGAFFTEITSLPFTAVPQRLLS